jgi:hypothetical protein
MTSAPDAGRSARKSASRQYPCLADHYRRARGVQEAKRSTGDGFGTAGERVRAIVEFAADYADERRLRREA